MSLATAIVAYGHSRLYVVVERVQANVGDIELLGGANDLLEADSLVVVQSVKGAGARLAVARAPRCRVAHVDVVHCNGEGGHHICSVEGVRQLRPAPVTVHNVCRQ